MRARHTFTTTVLAFFLLLSSGYGKAAQRYTAAVAVPAAAAAKPVAAEPVAPPPPVVIPLGDIATRATEVSNVLANLTASAAPSAQIETIAQTLPDLSEKLDVEFAITTKTLEAEPTLDVLQSLQQDWQRHELAAKRSLSALTLKAAKLQQSLNQITDLQKTWGNTRASAQQAKAPAPILQQIDATLAAITAAQAKLQSERAALLDLQSRVARGVNKCDTILAQIDQIQHQAVAGIFVATVPPIWRVELWPDAINALPGYLRGAGSTQWSEIVKYLREPHSDVLPAPALRAIFVSYDDNSINFELQVWPSRPNLSTQVRNDLASGVYHAVLAAGMSFPLPQREVRLLRDPVSDSIGDNVNLPAGSSVRPDQEDKSV